MNYQKNIFYDESKKVEPINNLKVGSCFSGVGMWELALKYLNIDHTQEFFIEWDKFPQASYKAIHGDVMMFNDVTKLNGNEVPDFDLFFYSPPCQAFSVAGKGLGAEEDRGVLFNDALRIIKAKQPKICIMENVKGLTNKKHSEFFNHILKSLENNGYTNYYKILNTKNLGVPQNRERIFIISLRNDIDNGFEWPEEFDNGLRLKDFLEDEVDEKYYISGEKCNKLLKQVKEEIKPGGVDVSRKGEVFEGNSEFCRTLMARDYKGLDNTIKTAVACLTPDRVEKRQNGRRFKDNGEPMFTLTGQDVHGILEGIDLSFNNPQIRDIANCISARTDRGISNRKQEGTGVLEVNELRIAGSLEHYGNDQMNRVYDTEGVSPTITVPSGGGREQKVLHEFRIRKLTPKECWRLQGVKDEDFEKAERVNSNSQLYKQAGNGVSVNVVMAILAQLQKKGYIK